MNHTARTDAHSTIAKALASHTGDHLGDVIWTSIGDVHVRRDAIRQIFAAAGVPENLAPADLSAEAAFGAAVSAFRPGDRPVFLRRVEANRRGSDALLVRQVRDASDLDKFETCARLSISGKNTGAAIDVRHGASWAPDAERAVAELEGLFLDRLDYATGHELNAAVVAALLGSWCGGIRLRDRGNVYWANAASAEATRKLASAIGQIGTSYIAVMPVNDSAEARSAVAKAANDSFQQEIADVFAELERFKAEAPRSSTLERRISEYQGIANRVELYADVLDAKKAALLGRLEDAKSAVRALLAAKDAA